MEITPMTVKEVLAYLKEIEDSFFVTADFLDPRRKGLNGNKGEYVRHLDRVASVAKNARFSIAAALR